MKKILLYSLIFVCAGLVAQAPRKFYTRFGGYGHDIGYSVIQTLNGQYAVTGSTGSFGSGNTDVYLALVDSMGWVRWEKSYGGFNNDIGKSIIQLPDSGFVIAGYTNSFGSGGYDMFVVRTDKAGTLIWQKTIGGLDWDFGNCVIQSSTGGFIIAGNTYSFGHGKSDAYLVKLDAGGNFVWQKTYGGAEDDNFKSVIETYNNQFAAVGATGSYGDPDGDAWLFKTDQNGDSLTSVKYGGSKKDFWNDLSERPANKNFILAGGFDIDLSDSTYAQVMEVDENGNFLFEAHWSYRNMIDGQFTAVAYLNTDPYFVLIRKQFNSTGNRKLEPMVMVTKPVYDIPGGVTPYGSPEDDELFDVYRTRDKGFICVGYTKGFSANLTDVYLVKLDSNYNAVTGAPSMVGIKETTKHSTSFKVYPTLTYNEIYIENDTDIDKIVIQVTDCVGNVVYKEISNESQTTLHLANLAEGVYFITLSENNYSKTFKIIKSN